MQTINLKFRREAAGRYSIEMDGKIIGDAWKSDESKIWTAQATSRWTDDAMDIDTYGYTLRDLKQSVRDRIEYQLEREAA